MVIRRTLGAVFTIAGGFFTYLFATRSMYHGRAGLGSAYDPAAPFLALGADYPVDVFLLLGASWAFLIGLALIITGESRDPSRGPRGGRVSRVMLMNGLLLISTLFVGYMGARVSTPGNPQTQVLAIFGLIALAQVALGLILIVLALFERPKGILSLPLGIVIYLMGVGVGVLAFLWGAEGA